MLESNIYIYIYICIIYNYSYFGFFYIIKKFYFGIKKLYNYVFYLIKDSITYALLSTYF